MTPRPTQAQRGGNKASMMLSKMAPAHSLLVTFGGNLKKIIPWLFFGFFGFLEYLTLQISVSAYIEQMVRMCRRSSLTN